LAELEQAHARLQEELTHVRAERAPATEEQASTQTRTHPKRNSRRKVLEKGLGVAVATVGAGTLLELSSGTALAASTAKPGVFASSTAGTPAVSATGTNGADGVDATSDSGIGVSAKSSSNTGVSATSGSGAALVATTGTGLAAHFVGGNVNMDKNLTVTGALSSGAGTFASSVGPAPETPAVKASGTSGAHGVDATSDSGIGVSGQSSSNTGVLAVSSSGMGLHAVGGGANATVPWITEAAIFAEGGPHAGVVAASSSDSGVLSSSDSGTGVSGYSGSGTGVHGSSGSGLAGLFDGNVQVNGNFTATGTKAFVQAHPTDPSREIVYVALEGGEAGTYVRGTGQLQSGKAVIALPEHFGLVTETSGLTVQLTPRGEWLQLYVVELDTAQLVVREAQGKSGEFDYLIHGVRRGHEQHEVIRTKR